MPDTLRLSYRGKICVGAARGSNPARRAYKAHSTTQVDSGALAEGAGFEPAARRLASAPFPAALP